MILDNYLVVFALDFQFQVTYDLPHKMVVWIRFRRLPYQYYHCDVLEGLGNLVGKNIQPHARTQHSVRAKFSRIMIEIDLTIPAPKGVFVDRIWQVVEYENLTSFCSDCGRFGHSSESCDRRSIPVVLTHVISNSVAVHSLAGITYFGDSLVEPEARWKIFVKKRWCPKMVSAPPNGSAISEGLGK
ncbi:hypothetical protein LINGRAHAP2_LOCUS18063 [Linum grandiflorum]